MSPSQRCVILVPVGSAIEPGCEDGLRELERRGYAVCRVRGYSAIDAARNQMASDALAQGFDELLWIDSDIAFDAKDVDKLRQHDLPLVCGIYPKKSRRQLACSLLPNTRQVQFGVKGGLMEILYCGFGFVLTRRSVYENMQRQLNLPVCNQRFQAPLVPYFAPLADGDGPHAWYLGEDYAFCERARRCGFRVMADTSIRLWHVGSYRFGWEDAGRPVERYHNFTFHVSDAAPPGQPLHADGLPNGQASKPALPRPKHMPLHEAVRPLPPSFPHMRAYVVSYPANQESLQKTLASLSNSDWGEEAAVFMQPADWPLGNDSAARTYKRALEAAVADGCDFAVLLEDDVRVNRWLRANLLSIPLLRRDQCDYFSLFMPDLIASPWQRHEAHLGYRLAKPLYSGPEQSWPKSRLWGAQGYVLSRRLLVEALRRWDELRRGKDSRVLTICRELGLPMWYSAPCLVQHAPLRSAHGTPAAYAADYGADYRLEVAAGFQPPEAVPGWLSVEEGRLLWQFAAGRRVLELGTALGRSTVCLGQQARRVVTVDVQDQSEAREWAHRFGVAERVVFHQGDVEAVCGDLDERFDLVFVDSAHDAASVCRDIEAGLRLRAPGGLMAFHDYPDPGWPDVRRVVDEYAARQGWQRVAQADYLGVFQVD